MTIYLHYLMVIFFGATVGVFGYANVRRCWVRWNAQSQSMHYNRYSYEMRMYDIALIWAFVLSVFTLLFYFASSWMGVAA